MQKEGLSDENADKSCEIFLGYICYNLQIRKSEMKSRHPVTVILKSD